MTTHRRHLPIREPLLGSSLWRPAPLSDRSARHLFALPALALAAASLVTMGCGGRRELDPDPRTVVGALVEGIPAQAEIAGGELHAYTVDLAAGDAVEVRAEQLGVNLVLAMTDPVGEISIEIDAVPGQGSLETLLWVAARSGTHRIEVRPLRDEAQSGRYSVTVTSRREADSKDRQDFAAIRLFAEGQRLQREPATRMQAVSHYEKAAALFQELGDTQREAQTLNRLGVALGELERLGAALDRFREAVDLFRSAEDPWGEAEALNYIGFVHKLRGAKTAALGSYRRALELRQQIGDRQGEAQTLLNIAVIDKEAGNLDGAIEGYERVLELQREIGDERVRADTLISLGSARAEQGSLPAARKDLLAAVETARAIGYREGEGKARHGLARCHLLAGDLQQALAEYRAALAIHRQRGDRRWESAALRYLGMLYEHLGKSDLSLHSLERAAQVSRELDDPTGQADALTALGLVELHRGHRERARRVVEQALTLAAGLEMPSMEAWARTVKADLALAQGATPEAESELDRALKLCRQLDNPVLTASVLERLAAIDRRNGNWRRARAHLLDALDLAGVGGNPSLRAWLLQSLAHVERARGDLQAARAALEEATSLVEDQRADLASLDLRASFLARREPIEESLVDLLMELHAREPRAGYDVAAFEASERWRSRSFLDELLAEGSGGGPALEARQRAQQISHQMSALGARLVELAGKKATLAERGRIEKRLEELEGEYRQVDMDLSATSALAARPLSLAEIQRDVLDGDTVLLQFFLGTRRSFVWRVTREDLTSFELPARSTIESAVETLRELVTAPSRVLEQEAVPDRRERLARAAECLPQAAARLADLILAPLDGRLDGKRLAVVADGALHQLPFGVLPEPGSGAPLLASREVVPIPSASVLAGLRRRPTTAGHRQIAVVADPVYAHDDPRVRGLWSRGLARLTARPAVVPPSEQLVLRSARGLGFDPLRRLRFSRREADVIHRLVADREWLDALDFEASRETVLSPRFAASDIIHFATHAILHPDTPGLSGIVLSLVDRVGRPRDGYLRLHDIYALDLGAELVVLSACRTGLGKEMPGEGPLGLPRAFLSAGARRVIASLWSVDDLATSELMTRFYTHLLGEGLSPSDALRRAQESLWEEGRPPSEWSGFVLMGDWR